MNVMGFNLSCEEYQDLHTHINSIGVDVWEKMTTTEKREDIRNLINEVI